MTTADSLKETSKAGEDGEAGEADEASTGRGKPVKRHIAHEARANLSRAKEMSQPGLFETLGTITYIEDSLQELFANDYTKKLHAPDEDTGE